MKRHEHWPARPFIIDVLSRMVVGWQASRSLRSDLAIDMAVFNRRQGAGLSALIHHSDDGVQYPDHTGTPLTEPQRSTRRAMKPISGVTSDPTDSVFRPVRLTTEVGSSLTRERGLAMAERFVGLVEVVRDPTHVTITISGLDGNLLVGGGGQPGDVMVRQADGRPTLHLVGEQAHAHVGGGGRDGGVFVRDASGNIVFHLDGNHGDMNAGGNGHDGDVFVLDAAGKATVHAVGAAGDVVVGAEGTPGNVIVRNARGQHSIQLNGESGDVLVLKGGNVALRNFEGHDTLVLQGQSGDIVMTNADCAEEFELGPDSVAEPGTVMVLRSDGTVAPCNLEADHRAVGIVSGAGLLKPAIVLDHHPGPHRAPIAVAGKVFCKVDAEIAPVAPGDLLTTGSRPGHAQVVRDQGAAAGAIIGKSLGHLPSGTGLVPVLVTMQ